MRSVVFLLLTGLLAGCIRTVDELSPDSLPIDRVTKPYVICFVSPQDTVLTAKIAMSEPRIVASFTESLVVKDAIVFLSDSVQTIQLTYDDNLRYYRAVPQGRFTIRPGVTYTLTVSMQGNRQVTAQATVPEAIPLDRIALDSTVERNSANAGLTTYRTTLFWKSSGKAVSYFRGWGEIEQDVVKEGSGQLLETRASQPVFNVDREVGGQVGSLKLMTGSHSLLTAPQTNTRTRRIRVGLLTTDENYYRYHAALREQFAAQNQNFATPTVLFSNISGGYGVFAAYNGSYLTVTPSKIR